MDNQIQGYITLKPIAKRFRGAVMTISNDEAKTTIREELRGQIRRQIEFEGVVNEQAETWLEDEDSCDFVMNYIRDNTRNKFK